MGALFTAVGRKPEETDMRITNTEFAKYDQAFTDACDGVKLKPTARQASKWRRGTGKAWAWHVANKRKAVD